MIRVGLAGYGLGGMVFHAPLIRACERMKLAAILTSREAPNRVEDLETLIERTDLIVISTPNTTHFPIARQALEAGKHVVVDKPFTLTRQEADALIALAEERGLVLSVFHNRRWDSGFLTLKSMLPRLGEIGLYEANWDRFRPAIKQGWREATGPGTGLWNDLGPHLVDQALQVFGMPQSVTADIWTQRPGAVADDYFDVTLHYPAMRACLRSSSLMASPRPCFSAHGSAGSFVKYGLDPQEDALKAGGGPADPDFGVDEGEAQLVLADGSSKVIPVERGRYAAFYEAVADSILDGRPVPVEPAAAAAGLEIIALARQSSDRGERLPVPGSSRRGARVP